MSRRDWPPCYPLHVPGECLGCLWEPECIYARLVLTGRFGPRRGDDRDGNREAEGVRPADERP